MPVLLKRNEPKWTRFYLGDRPKKAEHVSWGRSLAYDATLAKLKDTLQAAGILFDFDVGGMNQRSPSASTGVFFQRNLSKAGISRSGRHTPSAVSEHSRS
jgi:hypothetical protein